MSIQDKILSDSVYSAMRSAISVLRGVVAIPLITKLLGSGQYGIWTVLLTLATVLKTLGGVHLHGALIRYQDSEGSTEQSYADTMALTMAIATLLVVGCGIGLWLVDVDRFVNGTVGGDLDRLLAATLGLVVSEMVFMINVNFSRAKGDIRLYESISVAALVAEILVLVAVFLGGGGLFAGLLALLAVNVATNLVLFAYVYRSYSVPRPAPERFRRYLAFGLPMVPKDMSEYVLTHSDRYLILYFLSPSAVGVYAVAHGMGSVLQRISSVLNPTLYPTIATAWDEGRRDEIRSVYASIFRYYTVLAVPAFVGMTILSEPLLRVISTATIAERATLVLPLLALAFVVRGYETVIEYVLTAAEATEKMAVSTGVASVLNVVLNVALVPVVGIGGAALTTLVSQVVFTGMVYRYASAHVSVPFPHRCLLKSLVCAGVMGASLLLVPVSLTDLQTLAVYPVLGAATYFASMLLLGGVSPGELASFVRALG